jgi:integrase
MPNAKQREKLTKTKIEKLQPSGKEFKIWDTELPGFFIRVLPSGTKSFGVFYRDERGNQRKRSLGSTTKVSVARARERAFRALADLTRGYDQFLEQQKRRDIPTLEDFWNVYWEQHATHHKAASSRREDKSLWRNRIMRSFGKFSLDEISRSEVRIWHKKEKTYKAAANRALALLSKIFSLAIEHDLIDRNPCLGISKFHEEPRRTFLTKEQLKAFFLALAADHDRGAAAMVELLLLTGARRGEALKATWSEFDLSAGIWQIPSSHIKGGVRRNITITRNLSSPAKRLLDEWKSMSSKDERYVFPSPKVPGSPRYDIKAFWNRVRKRAELVDIRLHDIRHTFASLALESGRSLWEIGEELGHRSVATTKKYAHLDPSNTNTAAAAVGESLERLRPRCIER